ncbi:CBS domain-containing protein [Terrilactibacillus sp. BCM23-1]|uniref:CBS domain-containing protein n=1 Tax=Terrilactibacillus tamarindi TaxID=2599694 RepID=A0A6N8CMA3_9BACI|nr:CBS domain-containing protein [Terrilactibacillus tamarindi]MTT30728.1 CBS domain-containing protein [Terrilactibacillus tamarindi]
MDITMEDFNQQFKQIESYIKDPNYQTFAETIRAKKQINAIINYFESDLLYFSKIYNAINIGKVDIEEITSEPIDDLYLHIKRVATELISPPKVIPKFQWPVTTFDVNDSLALMLETIRDTGFTQFPVYDQQEFKGMVTDSGIAMWLSQNVHEDIISLSETTLKDILAVEEDQINYLFISQDMDVYSASGLLTTRHNHNYISALLITEHGDPAEELLGIITVWDVFEN